MKLFFFLSLLDYRILCCIIIQCIQDLPSAHNDSFDPNIIDVDSPLMIGHAHLCSEEAAGVRVARLDRLRQHLHSDYLVKRLQIQKLGRMAAKARPLDMCITLVIIIYCGS